MRFSFDIFKTVKIDVFYVLIAFHSRIKPKNTMHLIILVFLIFETESQHKFSITSNQPSYKTINILLRGRIWTMVAGGGASVIYSDTICALGGAEELANYGEYSGAPSEQQTYDYAKTLLSLMTR